VAYNSNQIPSLFNVRLDQQIPQITKDCFVLTSAMATWCLIAPLLVGEDTLFGILNKYMPPRSVHCLWGRLQGKTKHIFALNRYTVRKDSHQKQSYFRLAVDWALKVRLKVLVLAFPDRSFQVSWQWFPSFCECYSKGTLVCSQSYYILQKVDDDFKRNWIEFSIWLLDSSLGIFGSRASVMICTF